MFCEGCHKCNKHDSWAYDVLLSHPFRTSVYTFRCVWTHQPESHRREVHMRCLVFIFVCYSAFFLQCSASREGFSDFFPASIVMYSGADPRHKSLSTVGHFVGINPRFAPRFNLMTPPSKIMRSPTEPPGQMASWYPSASDAGNCTFTI